MLPNVVGPVLSERGCSFEYDEGRGLFYIVDESIGVRRAMFPSTFFATIARAVECARLHRPWRGAKVIAFPHAASVSGSPSK